MTDSNLVNKRAVTADQLRDYVVDMVKDVSQEQAEKMQAVMAEAQERSESVINANTAAIQAYTEKSNSQPKEIEKGLVAAGMVRCIAGGKKNSISPVDFAAKLYGPDHAVTKQLEASAGETGGFLVEGEFSSDVIELLRASSVVQAAGPRNVPLDHGTLTLPKHTTGATGTWIGEGSNLAHTRPGFGQITLTAKKFGATVAISNDLLRYATPDVDRMVRDDLVRSIATAEDLAFLRGDGTSAQPRGMLNIDGINTRAANGTANLANVTIDLGRQIQDLMDSNTAMARPWWFFPPRTWHFLFTTRDGNGNQVWSQEIGQGTLYGFPFGITTQIPVNLGAGSDESENYFVDMEDIVVGRASTIEVDASADAAYFDGTAVQASFSLDQTVVRAITRVDINARNAESIHVLTAVTWSA